MHDGAIPFATCEAASAPDAAGPRLERQLRMLERLAEFGLDIAEALAGQARHGAPKVTDADVALAYGRVSRAVRQAILLQSRLVDDDQVRAAAAEKALADARGRANQAAAEPEERVKCRVSRILARVIAAGHDDEDEIDRLVGEADERLDDDGLIGDVLTRPVSEIVADICRDLGLDPDWTRLAEEAWAKEELGSGEAGWPLAGLSSSPLPLDGGRELRADPVGHPP